MRRLHYIFRRSPLALIKDCVYYCWQNGQINDDEYNFILNYFKEYNYNLERSNNVENNK